MPGRVIYRSVCNLLEAYLFQEIKTLSAVQNLIHRLVLAIGFLSFSLLAISRDSIVLRNISALRNRYTDRVSGRVASLNKRRENAAAKALGQLQKTRATSRKELSKIYSSPAQDLFSTANKNYTALSQLRIPDVPGKYFPRFNTLSAALEFLTPFQHTGP